MKENITLTATQLDGPAVDLNEIGKSPMKELQEGFDSFEGMAKRAFEICQLHYDNDSPMAPSILAVCENNDVLVLVYQDTFDEGEREVFANKLWHDFRKWGVVRYIFVSEAWQVQGKGPLPEVPPSMSDNRVEVVITIGGDRDGRTFAVSRILNRNADGKVTIGEATCMVDGGARGRWFNLLGAKEPAIQHPAANSTLRDMIEKTTSVLEIPEEAVKMIAAHHGISEQEALSEAETIRKKLKERWIAVATRPVGFLKKEHITDMCETLMEAMVYLTERVGSCPGMSDIDTKGERVLHS